MESQPRSLSEAAQRVKKFDHTGKMFENGEMLRLEGVGCLHLRVQFVFYKPETDSLD